MSVRHGNIVFETGERFGKQGLARDGFVVEVVVVVAVVAVVAVAVAVVVVVVVAVVAAGGSLVNVA